MRFNSFFFYCSLLLVLAWASGLSADWQPYHARYAVYRDGKLLGKTEVTFEQHGNHWSMSSEGSGIQGLARLLGAKDNEYAEGSFDHDRFRPLKYTHHTRVAGIDDLWTAGFDWQNSTVDITRGKKHLTLGMGSGTLDALSLKLEMQRRLRDNDPDMMFLQVAKDKLKELVFRVLPPEQLETGLGCLQTIPVERVRLGTTRYSRSWHAPELEFIMVRLEHGKANGDDIEMRITELLLNQQEVLPQPACVALQNRP